MADLNKGKKQQLPSFCAVGLWEWIHRGIGLLVMCWTFLMLAVFPLYAPEKYQGLGFF